MFNYLKAEMYRILKKRSFYIINTGENITENVLMATVTMLNIGAIVVGIYIFTTVYNDDFNSKSMQAIIGYGIKRSKLVIYKITTTLLLSVVIYALLSIIFFINLKLLNVSLSIEELKVIMSVVAGGITKILIIAAIGGVFSFFYQKGIPGTIVFVLVISGVVDMFLNIAMGSRFVVDLIGDRTDLILGNAIGDFQNIIATGDMNITALIAVVVYFLGAILITIFTFKNRELEF